MKFNLPKPIQICPRTLLCAIFSLFLSTSTSISVAAPASTRPEHGTSAGITSRSGSGLAAPRPGGTVQVLELDQISRGYGHLNVRINNNALRVDTNNHGRYLLAWAPQWRIYAIDDNTRTFTPGSSNSTAFLMQRVFMIEGGDVSKVRWKEVRHDKIAGLPAVKLAEKIPTAQSRDNDLSRQRGYVNISDELKNEGFWVAERKVAPQAADCLAAITGLPRCGRVPMRFLHFTSTTHERMTVLDTSRAGENFCAKTLLRMPRGYRETRSEYDGQLEEFRNLAE